MWIPKWLGECYAKLFTHFGEELFTFQQAKNVLSANETKLAVAFSKLHTKRILLIFNKGKPRQYRFIEPESLLLLASETLKNVEKIPQERYLQLLIRGFRETTSMLDVTSFAVYGSVARGNASANSDIDVLLISQDLQGSLGSRIEGLYMVEKALEDELSWLRKHGFHTGFSFYPLRMEEAQRLPSLFLDLTEDAVILQDRNRFLEKTLAEFKVKLLRLGAKRIFTDKEHWYWDLKPDYKFGENVEVA